MDDGQEPRVVQGHVIASEFRNRESGVRREPDRWPVQPPPSVSSRQPNCCDNPVILYGFFAGIGLFVLTMTIVGLVSGRAWFGPLALMSILPAVGLMHIVYYKDNRSEVRVSRVVNMFCWGVAGALPCAAVELMVTFLFTNATGMGANELDSEKNVEESTGRIVLYCFFEAFFVAALCEESLKYILVDSFPGHKNARTGYSIIVLATAGALGFATLENIGYVFSDASTASLVVAGMRAILAVPLHASTGMIIGYYIAQRAMERQPYPVYKIMFWPLLVHGVYDCLLMLALAISREGKYIGILGFLALLVPATSFAVIYRKVSRLPEIYHNPSAMDYLLDP